MRIVIAGAGEVGSHLAKMLSNESNDITVIDSSQTRLNALSAVADVITVEGNPSAIKVLMDAGVDKAGGGLWHWNPFNVDGKMMLQTIVGRI